MSVAKFNGGLLGVQGPYTVGLEACMYATNIYYCTMHTIDTVAA